MGSRWRHPVSAKHRISLAIAADRRLQLLMLSAAMLIHTSTRPATYVICRVHEEMK